MKLLSLSVAFAMVGCASDAPSNEIGTALHPNDQRAMPMGDGGVPFVNAHTQIQDIQPEIELVCYEEPLPDALCDGGCGAGLGCCVTGVRTMGVCRTFSGCSDQCMSDCGYVARLQGFRAGAHCESLCQFAEQRSVCISRW